MIELRNRKVPQAETLRRRKKFNGIRHCRVAYSDRWCGFTCFVNVNLKKMKKLLEEFYSVLKEKGSPVVNFLNNGLNTNDIDRISEDLGFNLPKEAVELFEWRNGTDTQKMFELNLETDIFPLASFVPLEACLNRYKECLEYHRDWPSQLFVVFDSMIGDTFSIDVFPTSETYGMIYIDSPVAMEFGGRAIIYDSLQSCIETQIECYDSGAFLITEEGMDIDHKKKIEISTRLNKKSEYWKKQQ